jgi:hypothetical protein
MRSFQDIDHRTHFPIIIETSKSKYFNRDIYDFLSAKDSKHFVSLELYGFDKEILYNNFIQIYSKGVLNVILNLLGKNQ